MILIIVFMKNSPFRMRFFIHFLQPFDGVVCVHLRCCKAGMAKQLLDGVDVCPVVHQVCGKAVPQHVRALLINSAHLRQAMPDDQVHVFAV